MNSARIWNAMREERPYGFPIYGLVGADGDPEPEGYRNADRIQSLTEIADDARILDIGCGCGRVAVPFAERLGPKASYLGIDIVPVLVGFCARHITPVRPTFQFRLRAQPNPHYAQFMQDDPDARLLEHMPQEHYDLALGISLFTHLDAPDAVAVLREVAAATRPDGKFYATFFVLDEVAREHIQPTSRFQFKHASPSYRAFVERPEDTSFAVAYTAEQLDAILRETGWAVETHLPGAWSGRQGCRTYQDTLLLKKANPA